MPHELLAGARYGLVIVQSQFNRQPALLEMPDSVSGAVFGGGKW